MILGIVPDTPNYLKNEKRKTKNEKRKTKNGNESAGSGVK
jgi:hypothetical protein